MHWRFLYLCEVFIFLLLLFPWHFLSSVSLSESPVWPRGGHLFHQHQLAGHLESLPQALGQVSQCSGLVFLKDIDFMTFMSLADYLMCPLGSNLEGRNHVKCFPWGGFSTRREGRLTVDTGRGGGQRSPAAGVLSSPGEGTRWCSHSLVSWMSVCSRGCQEHRADF